MHLPILLSQNESINEFLFFFYFLLKVHGRESIILGSNFPNEDFDDKQFLRFSESKKFHF